MSMSLLVGFGIQVLSLPSDLVTHRNHSIKFLCGYAATDNSSFGYDMGWWKEDHFNASDIDGDGLLNITEFNE